MDVRYSARDLLGVPSLLSLLRVPLAASFPFVVNEPWLALAVIGVSALSDLADGWWARHFHQTTPTGALVDGITDKIFILVVAITLFTTGKLGPLTLALLGTRDLGEVVIGLAIVLRKDARALHEEQRANAFGKATTTLQILAVVLALFGAPQLLPVAVVTAVVGVVAAVSYARGAL
jgi:phosphatidylglycerophosphate synthase